MSENAAAAPAAPTSPEPSELVAPANDAAKEVDVYETHLKCYGTMTPAMMEVIRSYPECTELSLNENGISNTLQQTTRDVFNGHATVTWDNCTRSTYLYRIDERQRNGEFTKENAAAIMDAVRLECDVQKAADREARLGALQDFNQYLQRGDHRIRRINLTISESDSEFTLRTWFPTHLADMLRSITACDSITWVELHTFTMRVVDHPPGQEVLRELVAMITHKAQLERLVIDRTTFDIHSHQTVLAGIARALQQTDRVNVVRLDMPFAMGIATEAGVSAFDAVIQMLAEPKTGLTDLFLQSIVHLNPEQSKILANQLVMHPTLLRTDLTACLTVDDLVDHVIPNSTLQTIVIHNNGVYDTRIHRDRIDRAVKTQTNITHINFLRIDAVWIVPKVSDKLEKYLRRNRAIYDRMAGCGIGLK